MPRVEWVPAFESSRGLEAVELYEQATGGRLDEAQRYVLERGLATGADDRWAAFEVGVVESRQNGKDEIALATELAGMFLWGERLLIHSAHEFKTAVEHQRRLEDVIQSNPDLHKRVKPRGYRHSHGDEGIELRSGQRIRFMTRTKGAGRGHVGDRVILNEAMFLPEAMMGALMPTMSARSQHGNPQLWYFASAVDQMVTADGMVLARVRERALAGGDPRLAYFEWSADAAEPGAVTAEMARDVQAWAQANPALGIRISLEHVANEQRSLDPRTFAVERLSVGDWPVTAAAKSVIDPDVWDGLAEPGEPELETLYYAFDVTPSREWTSVALAGRRPDGRTHGEVGERRRGTGWVVNRLAELVESHAPAAVLCDTAGPAGSLVPQLEERGVAVTCVSAQEYANACGHFVDLVEQAAFTHLGTGELAAAVRGATKRPLGDKWAWQRRSGVDISPLVAVTLAAWGVVAARSEPEFAWGPA